MFVNQNGFNLQTLVQTIMFKFHVLPTFLLEMSLLVKKC